MKNGLYLLFVVSFTECTATLSGHPVSIETYKIFRTETNEYNARSLFALHFCISELGYMTPPN